MNEKDEVRNYRFPRETVPFRVFATWNIHYGCNYKCTYCHAPKPGGENVKKAVFISRDEWRGIWERNYGLYGTWELNISGGEPFAYPDFMELLIDISKIHLVGIITNLSCDVEYLVKRIKPERLKIETSYHPEFAGLDDFVKKLNILKSNGFTPTVNFVPWPPLLPKLKEFKEKIEGAGCQITLQPFIGDYEGRSYPKGYTDEERKYFDIFGDDCNLKTLNFKTTSEADTKKGRLCRMGQNYVFIHPDGSVSRCCRDHTFSLGNMVEDTFKLLESPVPCAADNCNCWRCMLVEKEEFWWRHWGRYEVTDVVFNEKAPHMVRKLAGGR